MSDQSRLHFAALLVILGSCLVLTACQTDTKSAYVKPLAELGFIAYFPPQGDPKRVSEWEKYGSGTIIRRKQQSYYYGADFLLDPDGIATAADPAYHAPFSLFQNKRVSGYEFDGQGGWTLDGANQIKAALQGRKITSFDVKFGPAHVANHLSGNEFARLLAARSGDLDATARRELRRGRFDVVTDPIYVESMTFFAKEASSSGGEASLQITAQDAAKLKASGFSIVEGGVRIDEPRFIAYRPLPATEVRALFP